MRRRLDLAAGLIGRPPVLFLDEPTTGLDPRTRNDLWQFIGELVAEGTTVLLTTQNMEEAGQLANGIVVLDAGRVVTAGTADELKDTLGGNMPEVRVTRQADLERAASIVAGLGSAAPRLDGDLNKISMPVSGGPRQLIAVGRALDDSNVALDDPGIRRPSLDDVFLAFTGHAAGPGSELAAMNSGQADD
jgi:ABC-2 type transport system ATP-binding protein